MPSNHAACQVGDKVKPLKVQEVPYTSPAADELVIRTKAVAINPADWAIQENGTDLFPFLNKFPYIGGSDVAGEVVEVGSAVTNFKTGDRVTAMGLVFAHQRIAEGAFQEYTVLKPNVTARIPDNMSFESAAVIPLGLCTAASGLFGKDYLALPHPSLNPKPIGSTLLIWGGSTSVGSNAIQLARAAGCEVITTCSPNNFEYVKKLGASQAFDYRSPTIVEDLIAAFKGKTSAGALSTANSWQSAVTLQDAFAATYSVVRDVIKVVEGSEGNKFVALANMAPPDLKTEVGHKFIMASALADNEVGEAVWGNYLPQALVEGKFVASPEPLVVGAGLENMQKAFETQKKGVSAKKVVVSL